MLSAALSTWVLLSAILVHAQQQTLPDVKLSEKRFESPESLPYKVDTDTHLLGGEQSGYNICNGTTENQESLCQTSYFNSIEDFCLWAPPEYGESVGNTERKMVAWCTKAGHGTRLIPEGTLQGIQWMKTPDYVQAVGFIDQTKINILGDDWGGEMDPHGMDFRGNPMGGVIFSNAYNGRLEQVIEWHNFIGGHKFCFKACDPNGPNAAHFCEHVFDRIGCDYNAPNNAQNNTFVSCEGENQDSPGTYTEDGQVKTYIQPDESLGPIDFATIPYTARVPASSNCVTHTSSALYPGLPTVASPEQPEATGSMTKTTGSGPSQTQTPGSAVNDGEEEESPENGASTLVVTGVAVFGAMISALLFV